MSVYKWHHNFCKIMVENCKNSKNRQKSLCAQLRIDGRKIWIKFHCSSLGPRTYRCTYTIFFCMSLYSADSNCQKFIQVVQKWLGTNKFVCTKVIQEVNFPKYQFFSAALDCATAKRQIPNCTIFVNFILLWGRIASPLCIIDRFGRSFFAVCQRLYVLYNALNVS